ncbi:alpha/beta fold hydrolase [uncultured Limosilactobacillus sp.]|uniref:alpha/beta fold hydrolase n=1 Tax=uncultured Limosilactobacillus sp. TaxID=2837629 RepID=UPI0025DD1FBD|nr:hypothetical protein [uncultured Limosilactobacillus sp.]
MGTVVVLPAFSCKLERWQQVKIGHRQLKVLDYQQFQLQPYTFNGLVHAVVKYLRTVPQPVILIGEDFGAIVALRASVDLLGRLDRLLLVRPHLQATNSLLNPGLFQKSPLDQAQVRTLKQSLQNVDLTNQLMHVQGLTYLFTGEQDRKNRRIAQELKNRLIDGHLEVVPKMGKILNADGIRALSENLR